MKLIDEWTRAHKLWSVRLNAAGMAILALPSIAQEVWGQLPPDLRSVVPHAPQIALAMFAAGIVARVIRQDKKDG